MQHIKDDNHLDIDPQDITYMGGLRKKLPLTFIAAVIGALALVGLPLTSGYLSKDGILIQAFEWSDSRNVWFKIIPVMALLTSWLTAFYVARLIFKVFFGEFRLLKSNPAIKLHLSDGNWPYTLPLILLAVCCLFPLFSFNPFSYEHAWLFDGLRSSAHNSEGSLYHTLIPISVNVISLLVLFVAYRIYAREDGFSFSQRGFFYRLSYNQWYIDNLYKRAIVNPALRLGSTCFWIDRTVVDGFLHLLARISGAIAKLAAWADEYIVDGFLHLLAAIVQCIGNFARKFQSGKVQYYLFSMLVIVLLLFILKILI